MIHLIVGRTASGKDTLANILKTKHHMNIVKSRTTRPKRSDADDSHIFVDKDTALYEIPNSIAYTRIDEQDYYAMPEDINNKQCYIIDMVGVRKLAQAMPDEALHIVYVYTSEEDRHARFIERALNKEKTEELWEARNASEDEQFTELEEAINSDNAINALGLPSNVRRITVLANDGDMEKLVKAAQDIADYRKIHNKLKHLANIAVKNHLIKTDEHGRIAIFDVRTHELLHASVDIMTGILQSRPEDLSTLIEWALLNTDLLEEIPNKI